MKNAFDTLLSEKSSDQTVYRVYRTQFHFHQKAHISVSMCVYVCMYHIPQNVNHGYFSGRIMDSSYFLICACLCILYIFTNLSFSIFVSRRKKFPNPRNLSRPRIYQEGKPFLPSPLLLLGQQL